jgi:RNA polymerase sigma-70 factor, ECF subfamily
MAWARRSGEPDLEVAMPLTSRPVPTAPPGTSTDGDLIRRVREGDVSAFELLMRRHNPRVYRTIRSVLRDEAEVEDAMQQSYVLAYVGLASFAGTSAFSTWLVRIALNEALGRLRGRARMTLVEDLPARLEDSMGTPIETPEERAATAEAVRMVEVAVDGLPAPSRSVFMLRDVEQLSTAETADLLGVSEDVVKVRLHRARHAVREALLARVGTAASLAFPFLAPRCDRVVRGVMHRLAGPARGSP